MKFRNASGVGDVCGVVVCALDSCRRLEARCFLGNEFFFTLPYFWPSVDCYGVLCDRDFKIASKRLPMTWIRNMHIQHVQTSQRHGVVSLPYKMRFYCKPKSFLTLRDFGSSYAWCDVLKALAHYSLLLPSPDRWALASYLTCQASTTRRWIVSRQHSMQFQTTLCSGTDWALH